jgi:hypothetical protein
MEYLFSLSMFSVLAWHQLHANDQSMIGICDMKKILGDEAKQNPRNSTMIINDFINRSSI